MDIPAPAMIGAQPSTALLAGPDLASMLPCNGVPVVMHELGGEKERASVGPRELLEHTRAALHGTSVQAWGAGARVSTPEEAAHFATAGFTWFTFDLSRAVDGRASSMSLEALDAAVVALEDRGTYAPGWYAEYIDREFTPAPGLSVRFSDEALARAAVKFAPAFTLAEDLDNAIRGCWSGRGELPDVEVALSPAAPATTVEELLFVSMELRRRLSVFTAIAPALGHEFEVGSIEIEEPDPLARLLAQWAAVAAPARISLPAALSGLGQAAGAIHPYHIDCTEQGRLAFLSQIARNEPARFRKWLAAACETFPISRTGWPISLSEEEARFLPEVEDSELEAMFLHSKAGRQLLLATWGDVRARVT